MQPLILFHVILIQKIEYFEILRSSKVLVIAIDYIDAVIASCLAQTIFLYSVH